ncbi:MAG: hypothetical protein GY793_06005 [Proteobacteria bacterium]|nr:hypothetical protein [Pseudomonadota bacterium]
MAEINNQQNLVNNSQFTGMIFVGVKQVEYFSRTAESDEGEVFEDVLEAIESKIHSGKLMLGFFSIPGLAGETIEKIDSICNFNTNANENVLKNVLKKIALIDYAEAIEDSAGEVHVLIAADCIIHWDSQGSYIQPTDEHSYLFDLADILNAYPNNHKVYVYTERDMALFKGREFEKRKVIDLPIMESLWYNQPSIQELYGNYVLLAGIVLLAVIYGVISWQKSSIEDVNSQISSLQAVKIDDQFYRGSTNILDTLSAKSKYKDVYSLVLKDISNGLSKSRFKLDGVIFDEIDKDKMIVRVVSKLNKHTQFTEQELLIQKIIDNTVFVKAIRKKTTSKARLELEALIDLKQVRNEIVKLKEGRT